MTKRQAKKVLRRIRAAFSWGDMYRVPTVRRARDVIWRERCRRMREDDFRWTSGFRWGKWDPGTPLDPRECPF